MAVVAEVGRFDAGPADFQRRACGAAGTTEPEIAISAGGAGWSGPLAQAGDELLPSRHRAAEQVIGIVPPQHAGVEEPAGVDVEGGGAGGAAEEQGAAGGCRGLCAEVFLLLEEARARALSAGLDWEALVELFNLSPVTNGED